MNIRGVKWSVDLSQIAWKRCKQEKPGAEWVHKWSDRNTIAEQNQRLLDEEQKQRQEVQ